MDKRLGNATTKPVVCAKTGKKLNHPDAGCKTKAYKDFYFFVRAAHGSLSETETNELKALAKAAYDKRADAVKPKPVAFKKESTK